MPSRSSRSKLVDVRETRHAPSGAGKIELRENRDGDLILTGYASTFDEYEVYGGPENWGWIERIDRHAFDKTLSESPDLHLLINHDGTPLARTKSGTLKLSVDTKGLRVEATLDKTDPDVQRLIPKMLRGDMDEMSFAFRVKANEWSAAPGYEEDDMSYRLITELSLQRGDVSVVNFGANPFTSAELSTVGQAVGVLANTDPGELRNADLDGKELRAAQRVLARLFKGDAKRDADEDPNVLLQGLDATLDEMTDIVASLDVEAESSEVGQLCALVGTADATIDTVLDLLGVYDADDDDDEAAGARKRGPKMNKRDKVPDLKHTRAAGVHTIAAGLRVEVGGTDKEPQVRLFDASGLLDEALCTVLASEVREAVLGNRGQITSSRTPAASAGDTIKVSEGLHLVGQTIPTGAAREEAKSGPPTMTLAEAKEAAG